jgi:hypothetical protein
MKIKKLNIAIEESLNIVIIGDSLDNQTMERITELHHEYSDIFPTTFSEMKGVEGELGEMKIPLRPDS